MGYKNKAWKKESAEAPYFILEKSIYRGLNVASLGYVVSKTLDERLNNKVYKYIVKLGPLSDNKTVVGNTIYDVACLSSVKITDEEILSRKCVVMVVFLDTNPLNFYYGINSINPEIDDRLGDDSGVESIYHDYRNAIIIGKLEI